jgi:glycosyltransferase involved in cell wall biosynthesis
VSTSPTVRTDHRLATALSPIAEDAYEEAFGTFVSSHPPETTLLRTPAAAAGEPAPPPRVTVVIPAMNEAENLPWVLERIPDCVDEVILVDGRSTDDTVAVARRCRSDIRVIQQRGRGKGMALRTGFDAATGDYIVMIDADGSMHPAEIEDFVAALSEGYEFVKGSRYLPEAGSTDITRLRSWGNCCLVTAVNTMFRVPFSDLCYGFVAFRRDVLPLLRLTAHGFEIETELTVHAVKAELRIAEVPSMELPRRNGVSNLNTFRDGGRVLRTLARERLRRRPPLVVDPLHRRSPVHVEASLALVATGTDVTVQGATAAVLRP